MDDVREDIFESTNCMEEALHSSGVTCNSYDPYAEGGTLHVDAGPDGGRPDAAVGCYYPTRDDSVYFDCAATTEGKLRVCYCDDGLPQWLKRKKNNNKGDEKHKVQLRHGALQPERVLWGDSRGARRRRD